VSKNEWKGWLFIIVGGVFIALEFVALAICLFRPL
jgi:hypothetical protein